jgi:hypothetical protein
MNETVNPRNSPHHNPEIPERRCHFIITNGQINYCGDCTHDLAGKSLPMKPFDEVKVRYYATLLQNGR